MKHFVVGISYRTAPVEVREQLSVAPRHLHCAGCRLKVSAGLDEVVVLSTCNRVEIYGVTSQLKLDLADLFQHLTAASVDLSSFLYAFEGDEALRHLFAVVSGLDSLVLGETEITGQVKLAYEAARQNHLTGPILNRVFQKAFQTAKQVRTQTQIGRGSTSVGSVAVDLAEKIFDHDLRDKSVLILGAGKMGEACVRHLAKKGIHSVLVSNRSHERGEALAAEFGGRAVRFSACLDVLTQCDIGVVSTGSHQAVLTRQDLEEVMRRRRGRSLVLIDIAVPRNIEPTAQNIDGLYLFDIDDLHEIVHENIRNREQELARCRSFIEDNLTEVAAKINPVCTPNNDHRLQPQSGWVLYGAAARCS